MVMIKPLPELPIRILAAWSAILSPQFRTRRNEEKAAWFLSELADPHRRLRFDVALRRLRYEWELIGDEAVFEDAPLRLQARLIEIGASHPVADELVDGMLGPSPIAKLFGAIMAQAVTDRADIVRIAIAANIPSTIVVRFQKPFGWEEVMRCPDILFAPLRGFARRAEYVGYDEIRIRSAYRDGCPDHVRFVRNDEAIIEIAIEQG